MGVSYVFFMAIRRLMIGLCIDFSSVTRPVTSSIPCLPFTFKIHYIFLMGHSRRKNKIEPPSIARSHPYGTTPPLLPPPSIILTESNPYLLTIMDL
jgi:hypothetical protein